MSGNHPTRRNKSPTRRNRSRSLRQIPEHLRNKRVTGEAINRAHGFAFGMDIALAFRRELKSGRLDPKKIADYINKYKISRGDGKKATYSTSPYYLLGRFAVVFGNRPELMQAAEILGLADKSSAAKEIMVAAKAKKLPREVRELAKVTKLAKSGRNPAQAAKKG